jgi:hypothetical protein
LIRVDYQPIINPYQPHQPCKNLGGVSYKDYLTLKTIIKVPATVGFTVGSSALG